MSAMDAKDAKDLGQKPFCFYFLAFFAFFADSNSCSHRQSGGDYGLPPAPLLPDANATGRAAYIVPGGGWRVK